MVWPPIARAPCRRKQADLYYALVECKNVYVNLDNEREVDDIEVQRTQARARTQASTHARTHARARARMHVKSA